MNQFFHSLEIDNDMVMLVSIHNILNVSVGWPMETNSGIAFMHSHPVPGWQDMSYDDIAAEKKNGRFINESY